MDHGLAFTSSVRAVWPGNADSATRGGRFLQGPAAAAKEEQASGSATHSTKVCRDPAGVHHAGAGPGWWTARTQEPRGGCRCAGCTVGRPTRRAGDDHDERPARRHSCTILPPYLLERVRRQGDPRAAAAAEHTLALDGRVRARRELRAARRGGDGAGAPHPGRLRAPGPAGEGAAAPGSTPRSAGPAPAPHRAIHDAAHTTTLPGTLVRAEGGAATADPSVTDAYDHLGATWQLYWQAYRRDSLDGRGLPLVASVHYGVEYDNAFWDGTQMVFGDGDGVYFNAFTDSVDVIGHELTHGVTQYTAGPRPTSGSPAP